MIYTKIIPQDFCLVAIASLLMAQIKLWLLLAHKPSPFHLVCVSVDRASSNLKNGVKIDSYKWPIFSKRAQKALAPKILKFREYNSEHSDINLGCHICPKTTKKGPQS